MKKLYEDEKLRAELDGELIVLTQKATGKRVQAPADADPHFVCGPAINQLKAAGKNPDDYVMLGDAVLPKEVAEQIIRAARGDEETKLRALIEERERLVRKLEVLIEEHKAQHERMVELTASGGVVPAIDDLATEVEAAREALRKFDEEHPEVKARLNAERAKMVEEHMWD